MMFPDRYGVAITARRSEDAAAVDSFTAEILSHGKQAAALLPHATGDSGSAMVEACAAALHLFLQTGEGHAKAMPHLEQARSLAPAATDREQHFVKAIDAWARHDIETALDHHALSLKLEPRDMLSLKIAQIHQLNRGDSDAMRGWALASLDHAVDIGFAWGLAAFGLEQCGAFAEAEAAGLRAVEINADDPWAHHAVAHVMQMQGRTNECLDWMAQNSPRWDRCSSFLYTHNWWHTALSHIDSDDSFGALELFDKRVWGVRKGHVQDQVNAIALLARLELQGVDVGDRWQDIADHVDARIHDHCNGFLDMHFIYALARAGRSNAVHSMMKSLRHHANHPAQNTPLVWSEIALPTAEGLLAFAEGRFELAAEKLSPVMPTVHRLGGSTAQRDMFEQIYIQSLIRSSTPQLARSLMDRRLLRRGDVPWEKRTWISAGGHNAGANPVASDRKTSGTADSADSRSLAAETDA